MKRKDYFERDSSTIFLLKKLHWLPFTQKYFKILYLQAENLCIQYPCHWKLPHVTFLSLSWSKFAFVISTEYIRALNYSVWPSEYAYFSPSFLTMDTSLYGTQDFTHPLPLLGAIFLESVYLLLILTHVCLRKYWSPVKVSGPE